MALIACSECGNTYSDKANACPSCGCPTNLQSQTKTQSQQETEDTLGAKKPARTNNKANSSNNDKLKVWGIISIGAGAIVALSSGLISGSEEYSYLHPNTGVRQTNRFKSDGEKLTANGFLALGILGIASGAAMLTGMGVTGKSEERELEKTQDKADLYRKLIHLVYKDTSLSGTPSLHSSELSDEELIIKTHNGERICSFVKTSNTNSDSNDSWKLKK